MTSRLMRVAATAMSALLLVGAGVALGGGSASAASPATGTQGLPYLGKLSLPTSGNTSTAFDLTTFNPCQAGSTRVLARIDNAAAGWNNVALVGRTSNGVSTTGGMTVPSGDSLAGTASSNGLTLSPGTYQITLLCAVGIGAATGEFDGVVTVGTPNTAYTSPSVTGPFNTTTSLGTSPVSPRNGAGNVTITATITPAASGAVDFFDNGVKINANPVPVSGGTASVTTPLAVGIHPLTASFTSDDIDSGRSSATAAPTSYVVNAFTATSTTTALGVNPSSGATTIDSIAFTATVTPSNVVGTVEFYDAQPTPALLGTATVSGGTATLSKTLAAGTYKFQAAFVPGAGSGFAGSSSPVLPDYLVATYAGASASETLQAVVDAGTLTITAGGPPVDLGHLALNSANDLLVSTPTPINDVTVTDSRAGNVHWTASGQVSDFVDVANPSSKINGGNLGWTPAVKSKLPVQTIGVGAQVQPGAGLPVSDASGAGLKTSRELAHSVDGASVGTAVLTATVVLQAPTSTPVGTYQATLTLTAI